ncbi:MAG TPA: GNAT family N-acetyltransferase [Sphingomicrobium sp.]
MAKIVARTERLLLREWDPEDEERFYAVMNRPEVMRHLGGLQTSEEWHAAFERVVGFQRNYGHTFWIVEDGAGREILGFCGIKRVNAPGAGDLTGRHEIGWRLRPESWGQGIAKEAAIASLDLAFGPLDAPDVIATTIPANEPSQGLMKRLGMTRREDLDYVDTRFGPDMNPTVVFQINADEWPAARAAALS